VAEGTPTETARKPQAKQHQVATHPSSCSAGWQPIRGCWCCTGALTAPRKPIKRVWAALKAWLANSPTLTIQGRIRQVHGFFRARSPAQLLEMAAPTAPRGCQRVRAELRAGRLGGAGGPQARQQRAHPFSAIAWQARKPEGPQPQLEPVTQDDAGHGLMVSVEPSQQFLVFLPANDVPIHGCQQRVLESAGNRARRTGHRR
jgi:hypothetical protein